VLVRAAVGILSKRKKQKAKKGEAAEPAEMPERVDRLSAGNYEAIAKKIGRRGGKSKCVLFASAALSSMPVTIPVNVAIELAKNKKRCLLIDLDIKRDAIAKAFELDGGDLLCARAVQTELANIWVWPAHYFARLTQMNIAAIVQKAADKFDFVLINAPSLVGSPDRRLIISTAQAAVICTKSGSDETRLSELIKLSGCPTIGRIETP
jgi:Mrp family chromosome partitioning ATPase